MALAAGAPALMYSRLGRSGPGHDPGVQAVGVDPPGTGTTLNTGTGLDRTLRLGASRLGYWGPRIAAARVTTITHDFAVDNEKFYIYDYAGPPLGSAFSATWESSGGPVTGPYIWADDSRWSVDTPETPDSVLALFYYRQSAAIYDTRPRVDMRNATVTLWVRGNSLDLLGGSMDFWVHDDRLQTRYHHETDLTWSNGTWTQNTLTLTVVEADWHRSWNPATDGTLKETLENVISYGIGFKDFSAEPTGRIDLADITITPVTEFLHNHILRESVRVSERLNQNPNTASCDLVGVEPALNEELILGQASLSQRLFRGTITSVTINRNRLEETRPVWHVEAIDWTRHLDAALVIKRYGQQDAAIIADDLVATYASPGLFSIDVAATLGTVDGGISFTMVALGDALTRLVNRIGGYWYVTYDRVVRVFVSATEAPSPETLTATNRHISRVTRAEDIDQLYNRVFVEGLGTSALIDVVAGSTTVPVADVTNFSTGGGVAKAAGQLFAYTGVIAGGGGALVGVGAAPTTAPSVQLEAGAGIDPGVHQYAIVFVTAAGSTPPGPLKSYTVPTGQLAAPSTIGAAYNDGIGSGPTAGGVYSYKITFAAKNGTGETTPSAASNNFTSTGKRGILELSQGLVPLGYDLKVYRTEADGSVWKLVTSWSAPYGYVQDSTADGALGANAPSSNTADQQRTKVSVTAGPTGVTDRELYRTAAGASQLKLVTTIAGNTGTTVTDSTADSSLGANAPTSDTSGLTRPDGIVLAGSTEIQTTALDPFDAAGGWALVGQQQVISYTGTDTGTNELTGVPATGAGSLTSSVYYDATIEPAPQLIGIPAAGEELALVSDLTTGDEINLVVVVQDGLSQSLHGQREYYIQDRRLSLEGATDLGEATLALHATARVKAQMTSTDPKASVGKLQPVNLWGINESLRIQSVEITVEADRPSPRRRLTLSSRTEHDLYAELRSIRALARGQG